MGRVYPWVWSGPDFSQADPGIQLRGHYGERAYNEGLGAEPQ